MTATPPTTTRRRESETGSWWMVERPPHSRLAPYVKVYEDYESVGAAEVRDRHAPFGGMPLIWTFEGRLDQVDLATGGLQRSDHFIAGLHDRSATTVSSGRTRGVQVNLTPIGARMLLGVPMHELTNTFMTLDAAPGADWPELGDQLEHEADSDRKFDLLDAFFTRQFAEAAPVPEGVAWAWHQIERSHGSVPISSLSGALGVTRKRMVQDFREFLGLPPKTMARIARFNRAVTMVERQRGTPSWTRVATECGYYDQAHFIREVRALTGETPTEMLRRLVRPR